MEHTSYSTDTGANPEEVPRALMGNWEGQLGISRTLAASLITNEGQRLREGSQLCAMIPNQLLQKCLE